MTAVILAGGKSSRMGSNKAFLKLNGKAFIERQIDLLREMFDEIFISANTPSEYEYLNLPVFKDLHLRGSRLRGRRERVHRFFQRHLRDHPGTLPPQSNRGGAEMGRQADECP